MCTFDLATITKKVKINEREIVIRSYRDIFARFLVTQKKKALNLNYLLRYCLCTILIRQRHYVKQ